MHAVGRRTRWLGCILLTSLTSTASASALQADRRTQEALRLDADPQSGARQYEAHCQTCHGIGALGARDGSAPVLAGQRFSYLVRQLANFSARERDSGAMHGVLANPSLAKPQAWVDVAAYLNKAPIDRSTLKGNGSRIALGRGIFHEQCASCHQADARGSEDGFVPSLRNQNYPYLVNQIHAVAGERRHNVDENLVRFMRSFELDDVHAVADYLSRLQGPGRQRKAMRDNGVVVD